MLIICRYNQSDTQSDMCKLQNFALLCHRLYVSITDEYCRCSQRVIKISHEKSNSRYLSGNDCDGSKLVMCEGYCQRGVM